LQDLGLRRRAKEALRKKKKKKKGKPLKNGTADDEPDKPRKRQRLDELIGRQTLRSRKETSPQVREFKEKKKSRVENGRPDNHE